MFEGVGTPGDGTYQDHTLPHYFPDGDMCLNCKSCLQDCSSLNFEIMKPILGYYLDGTCSVRCTNFDRK